MSDLFAKEGTETGFAPSDADDFASCLTDLLHRKIIAEDDSLLELGAGFGHLMITAARARIPSYGIEYHPGLAARGRIDIRRQELFVPCKLVQGSYYLAEYIRLRQQGQTRAPFFEHGAFVDNPFSPRITTPFSDDLTDHVYHLEATIPDPYSLLGIGFHKFDVFFSYTWGIELPSILEQYARYAQEDAIFLNHSAFYPVEHKRMLKDIGLSCTVEGKMNGNPLLAYTKQTQPF
jgi:hypothetical protein